VHTQWVLLLAMMQVACDRPLEIGQCSSTDGAAPPSERIDTPTGFAFPWSTSFETGFCGYAPTSGFCYRRGSATYELVTSPVHTGNFAVAYTINSDPNNQGTQARCVRQGTFPTSAYYSAWFYIPSAQIVSGTWNLMYISGSNTPSGGGWSLWDVSLVQTGTGELRLSVTDYVNKPTTSLTSDKAIPINTWFKVNFYLKRAKDATGEIKLYQDEQLVLNSTGITENSNWGQWYVGNYATDLSPLTTTVYVDDVALSPDP